MKKARLTVVLLCSTVVIFYWLYRDKSLAFFYQKACNMNYGAGCYELGRLYSNGKGVKQDDGVARAYWKIACDKDYAEGCVVFGVLYEQNGDDQKAKTYYEKACIDLNDGSGCVSLGDLYNFQGVIPADPKKQSEDLCNGRCVRKDYQKAKTYYEKSCNDLNNLYGCSHLAYLYEEGKGVKQDYQKAKEYYGKACDLGLQQDCYLYRKLNEKGY